MKDVHMFFGRIRPIVVVALLAIVSASCGGNAGPSEPDLSNSGTSAAAVTTSIPPADPLETDDPRAGTDVPATVPAPDGPQAELVELATACTTAALEASSNDDAADYITQRCASADAQSAATAQAALVTFCATIVGDRHPPDVATPDNFQGDAGLPEIECGYTGHDPLLTYDEDGSSSYYVFVTVGFPTADTGFGLGDTAETACDGVAECRTTDGAVLAVDPEYREVFAYSPAGVSVHLSFQDAGAPPGTEARTRLFGVLDALGLPFPDEYRA